MHNLHDVRLIFRRQYENSRPLRAVLLQLIAFAQYQHHAFVWILIFFQRAVGSVLLLILFSDVGMNVTAINFHFATKHVGLECCDHRLNPQPKADGEDLSR